VITIDDERWRCTELLFDPLARITQPNAASVESNWNQHLQDGVHQMIYNAIHKCDSDIRHELWNNIVVNGGNTLFPGFDQRLEHELKTLLSSITTCAAATETASSSSPQPPLSSLPLQPRIHSTNRSMNATWLGGAIVASLSTFHDRCIHITDYDEYGPTMVHRKC
jgi:actin-related protein